MCLLLYLTLFPLSIYKALVSIPSFTPQRLHIQLSYYEWADKRQMPWPKPIFFSLSQKHHISTWKERTQLSLCCQSSSHYRYLLYDTRGPEPTLEKCVALYFSLSQSLSKRGQATILIRPSTCTTLVIKWTSVLTSSISQLVLGETWNVITNLSNTVLSQPIRMHKQLG